MAKSSAAVAVVEPWRTDWRDPKQYPDASESLADLGWQLLRRSGPYSGDFMNLIKAHQADFSASELDALDRELAAKWGLRAMQDPASSARPQWSYCGADVYLSHPSDSSGDPRETGRISLTFDLAQPLGPRLRSAHNFLTRYAEAWLDAHPDRVRPAVRVGKPAKNRQFYIDALRTHDAAAAGAPLRVIARVIFKGEDIASAQAKVRYLLTRARKLIDGGYRDLVANAVFEPHEPMPAPSAVVRFCENANSRVSSVTRSGDVECAP